MKYKLLNNLSKTFDDDLNIVDGDSLGSIYQTDDLSTILTAFVPNIDESTDSCYLTITLPVDYPTKIQIPKTIPELFEYSHSENGNLYYKVSFKLDSRITKYPGQVKMNLVILHDTGEYQIVESSEDEKTPVEIVSTKNSESMFLTVLKSNNYYVLDFSTEDEQEEAIEILNALLNEYSSLPLKYLKKENAILKLDKIPDDLNGLKNKVIFSVEDKKMFLIDENAEMTDLFVTYPELENLLNTKLEKIDSTTDVMQAYIKEADGKQSMLNIDEHNRPWAIVRRDSNNNFKTGNPIHEEHATPKKYVDNKSQDLDDRKLDKITGVSEFKKTYVKYSTGAQGAVDATDALQPNTFVIRDPNNTFRIGDPTHNQHPTTKQYVDNAIQDVNENKLNKLNNLTYGLYAHSNGEDKLLKFDVAASADSIAFRDNSGGLIVNANPTKDGHATPKSYVDNAIQNVMEVAEGKTRTITIDLNNHEGYYNHLFASNNNYVEIYKGVKVITTDNKEVLISDLKVGDIILIDDLDYPDRWLSNTGNPSGSYMFSLLETRKIDLTGYYTKDETDALIEPIETKVDAMETLELNSINLNSTETQFITDEELNTIVTKLNSKVNFLVMIPAINPSETVVRLIFHIENFTISPSVPTGYGSLNLHNKTHYITIIINGNTSSSVNKKVTIKQIASEPIDHISSISSAPVQSNTLYDEFEKKLDKLDDVEYGVYSHTPQGDKLIQFDMNATKNAFAQRTANAVLRAETDNTDLKSLVNIEYSNNNYPSNDSVKSLGNKDDIKSILDFRIEKSNEIDVLVMVKVQSLPFDIILKGDVKYILRTYSDSQGSNENYVGNVIDYVIPANTYFKLVISPIDNVDIPEIPADVTIQDFYLYEFIKIENYLKQSVESNEFVIKSLNDNLIKNYATKIINGYLHINNGSVVKSTIYTTEMGEICTDLIDVIPGEVLSLLGIIKHGGYWNRYCFYDSNKQIIGLPISPTANISNVNGYYGIQTDITVPANVKYFRYSLRTYNVDYILQITKNTDSFTLLNQVKALQTKKYIHNVKVFNGGRADTIYVQIINNKSTAYANFSEFNNDLPLYEIPCSGVIGANDIGPAMIIAIQQRLITYTNNYNGETGEPSKYNFYDDTNNPWFTDNTTFTDHVTKLQ